MYLLWKYAITSALVVMIAETAKRSDKAGALIASLPTVTILTLCWLFFEKQPVERISNHAWYTFWYVLPTLPMFPVFPIVLKRFGFLVALACLILGTVAIFWVYATVMKKFTIELM